MTGHTLFNHGPGKGDTQRPTDTRAFRANFDEIKWGGTIMRRVTRNRYRKTYGARSSPKLNVPDV